MRRGIIAVIAALSVAPAAGQSAWRMDRSVHFDIHYQPAQRPPVAAITQEVERAYARISADLGHELSERMPVIVVERDVDLPRNGAEAAALVTASGASLYDHLMLSLETFNARRWEVVAHELTHQFLFELLPQAERNAPWVTEALPDHYAGVWDAADLTRIREAQARAGVPAIESLTAADRHWGHAAFDFVAADFGARGIRQYLAALRDSSSASPAVVISALGVSSADFNRGFERYISSRLGK